MTSTALPPSPELAPAGPGEDRAPYAPRTPDWVRATPTWLWWTVGILALMALSAYVRSRYLSSQLWMDEAITTGISVHPFSQIPGVLRLDGNPPLYYLMLHVWISWFGDSESATHSLSLVAGLLTIPVGAWGAHKLFGTRAAWMAALLFAFNAWLTGYAQETRMYELMGLLGLVATVAYVLAFIQRRRGYLWLFGAALATMLYTHTWGTFFFAGSAIALVPALLASEDRKRFFRDAVYAYVGAGILFIPWVPTLLFQVAHTAAPWGRPPRAGAPIQISRNLLGGDRITIVLVFAAAIGLGPLFARRLRRSTEQLTLWTLILLPICVLALAWIASQANPAWAARYFAPVLGSLILLIAWGLSRARTLGIIALALGIWYLHNPASFAPKYKSDMREIGAEMSSKLHAGDIVVVGQPEQTPLSWYYLPAGLRFSNTAATGLVDGKRSDNTAADGLIKDPRFQDWDDVLKRIKHEAPTPALNGLVAQLRPGQQLLFVRPLTEGAQNWKAPWTSQVRRRSAQWTQGLSDDVRRGILRPVAYAPHDYHDAGTVADSAVLYRRVR